jgi:hypothetical protein
VFVVDWRRGELLGSVTVTGGVQELYDVAILPQTQRPRAIGFRDEDIQFLLNIGPAEAL